MSGKKVVFLDDGSATARRLKRAMGALGRGCWEARDADQLREAVLEGASVVIHVPSDPRKFANAFKRFTREFPHVPVLHIIEESLFQPNEWLVGPFHEWISITATIETVLRKIDTLDHFAGLERQLNEAKRTAERIDRFTRSIRGVDTTAVLKNAMALLRTELRSGNVIWFPEDSLHKEIDRYFAVKTATLLPTRQPTRMSWLALEDVDHAGVEALFDRWGLMTAATGGLDAEPTEIVCRGQFEVRDLIVPLRASKDRLASVGRPYGHLVFIEPYGYNELRGTPVFAAYMDLLSQQLEEAYEYGRLQTMTYKDDLTDLYNQRYLPVVLEQELNRASRLAKEFSVLFCDVDFFKMVNDTKGHMVGSRVLIELSKVFKSSIRSTDFAFRYGGDEYVIVLSGANSKNAAEVAERLRRKTADTTFNVSGKDVKITVSIGIATYPEHAKSAEEILHMADEAMYYGKNKSRNVVYVAS